MNLHCSKSYHFYYHLLELNMQNKYQTQYEDWHFNTMPEFQFPIDTKSLTIELTLRIKEALFSYMVLWVTNCELRSKQEIWFTEFIWSLRFNKQSIALHFDYKFLNGIHFIVCKSVYYSKSLFTEKSTWLDTNLRQMYWKWFKK